MKTSSIGFPPSDGTVSMILALLTGRRGRLRGRLRVLHDPAVGAGRGRGDATGVRGGGGVRAAPRHPGQLPQQEQPPTGPVPVMILFMRRVKHDGGCHMRTV